MRYLVNDTPEDPAPATPVLPPPASLSVEAPRRPVLWLPDGRAIVRQVGFSVKGGR